MLKRKRYSTAIEYMLAKSRASRRRRNIKLAIALIVVAVGIWLVMR